MENPYIGLLALMGFAAAALISMLLAASWLGPKHKTKTKQLPFECGSVSVGDMSTQRFNVRFYIIAMLFILFDIEVIFLYPWAVVMTELGPLAFYEMLSFMVVLGVGLIYVWKKGLLNWNDEIL